MQTMNLQLAIKADSKGCLIIPNGSTINGLLNLADRKDIRSLPVGLSADAVDLSGSAVSRLPKGMKVSGWLDIQNTGMSIETLPEDLEVGTVIFCTRDGKPASISSSLLASRS